MTSPRIQDAEGRELSVGDRVRYSWSPSMRTGRIEGFEDGMYGPEVLVRFPSRCGGSIHRSQSINGRCPDLLLIDQDDKGGGEA